MISSRVAGAAHRGEHGLTQPAGHTSSGGESPLVARCSSSLYQHTFRLDYHSTTGQTALVWFQEWPADPCGQTPHQTGFRDNGAYGALSKEAQHALFAFDIFRLVGARIYETRSFSFIGTSSRRHHRQRMLLTLVVISSARRPATRVRYKEEKNPSAVPSGDSLRCVHLAQPLRYGRARLSCFSFSFHDHLGSGLGPMGGQRHKKSGGETSPRCRPPTETSMEGR